MTTSQAINKTPGGVLVTGGGRGIGLGLAARYLASGRRVLVTGRSADRLNQAVRDHPGLEIFVSDIASAEARVALAEHVRAVFPTLDVVVNNAGFQRRVPLA